MRAGVVGLGIVGATMLRASRALGTLGVDVNPEVVSRLRSEGLAASTLVDNLRHCDPIFICVGTPSLPDGSVDPSHIDAAIRSLRGTVPASSLIVLRSTVFPDALEDRSGLVANPEFLRMTSALEDFMHPPYVVVGSGSEQEASRVFSWYRSVGIDGPYLRVGFANTVGDVARCMDADADVVMSSLLIDPANTSSAYLKPGGPFGGICIPKDLAAGVRHFARVDLLDAVARANHRRSCR
jgi:GDP-mannose 6-dehydrogenase